MQAILDHIDDHGNDIKSFWLQPERSLRFSAGQYIELYLPHQHPDDRGTRRWFTISSSSDETLIALTTEFPNKPSSYKRAMRALRPGDSISLSDPIGDFVLPKDRLIPLTFIAAGTGCTPYASMIKWLHDHNESRDIQFIYAASRPDRFLFNDLWKAYKTLHITRIVSDTYGTWNEHIGHLNVPFILQSIRSIDEQLIYLAGPQSLIEPLYEELLAHIPRHQLLLDYFPGY